MRGARTSLRPPPDDAVNGAACVVASERHGVVRCGLHWRRRRWHSTSLPVARPHDDAANGAACVVAGEHHGVIRCGLRRRRRVVPSPYEERKIVTDWAKRVACDQRGQYWKTTATVLTFGSYALGNVVFLFGLLNIDRWHWSVILLPVCRNTIT
ncbi:hypothetical protein ABZP36_018705 [Zizania latifolia]